MDPLSEVLSLLKPRATICGGFDVGGALSVQFPPYDGIKCCAVVSGERWLCVDGVPDPVRLTAGDCFLLLLGRPFRLTTDLSLPATDAVVIQSGLRENGGIVTINGGGGCFTVGGHFHLDGVGAGGLLGLLPPIVHLRKESERKAIRWSLERTMEELRDPQPGSLLIVQSLATMMLVQALRLHLAEEAKDGVGWISALADPQVGRAVKSMHDNPSHRWTLQELAESAGMSRSAFAVRFKEKAGESAMGYLTRWRMLLAADRLTTLDEPVSEIAEELGYESESAFSAAFKKVMGCPPRRYSRDRQLAAVSR